MSRAIRAAAAKVEPSVAVGIEGMGLFPNLNGHRFGGFIVVAGVGAFEIREGTLLAFSPEPVIHELDIHRTHGARATEVIEHIDAGLLILGIGAKGDHRHRRGPIGVIELGFGHGLEFGEARRKLTEDKGFDLVRFGIGSGGRDWGFLGLFFAEKAFEESN